MNYLSVENLSKHYGERMLFENLNFGLSKGDKVALVANNGAGKSTLLKIVVGNDNSESGGVTIRNGVRAGYLDQEPAFNENFTLQELISNASSRMLAVIREYEQSVEAHANNYNDETQRAFEKASAKMDELEAWDHERKMMTILSKFNIVGLDRKISMLSGGQRKRLALALLLLDTPDLLILDEPTNHLDVDMIEWLEMYLMQPALTLLMVTHDRYFLDRVCNNILELTDGRLYHHAGNYSYFIEKRAQREEIFNTEVAKAQKLMKRELEWMRKMPKARTTKSKSRITSFYEVKDKLSGRKIKQELKLDVKMSRVGGKILELKKVYKSYNGIKLLNGFDYSFRNGERIGIVGRNGTGKSTFLNIITGNDVPDSGKVNTGDTIVYGYYSQAGIKLKEDKRVIEVVKDIADVISLSDGTKLSAAQFLQHFMFPPEMQYTFVSKLSGGERRRLYLLTVLIKNPNFLILDEPTNDLDLLILNKLEEFLFNYKGCVIIVSHDRYFLDKLVDHLFIFEGDGVIRDFIGTYTEYRNAEDEKELEEKRYAAKGKKNDILNATSSTYIPPSVSGELEEAKKLTYVERKEYEKLEKEIENLEYEKKVLEAAFTKADMPYDDLAEMSARIGVVMEQIEEKTARWLELSENIG